MSTLHITLVAVDFGLGNTTFSCLPLEDEIKICKKRLSLTPKEFRLQIFIRRGNEYGKILWIGEGKTRF